MATVIQSWLMLIGLLLDLVGFCFIFFEVWLSYQKTYDRQERERLEKDQLESDQARSILEKPLIATESANVWRKEAFMNGGILILFGFLLQIAAVLMGGGFAL